MEVNRYLEDKAMDHIDHALGRPVNPMSETYRNYFYVCGDTELRREMGQSPCWTRDNGDAEECYFHVTDFGKLMLKEHLAEIGDKHRVWIITYDNYEMPVVAESAAKAKYSKWLDLSDAGWDLEFGHFLKTAKVRLA